MDPWGFLYSLHKYSWVGTVLDAGGEAGNKTKTLLMEKSKNEEIYVLSGHSKR